MSDVGAYTGFLPLRERCETPATIAFTFPTVVSMCSLEEAIVTKCPGSHGCGDVRHTAVTSVREDAMTIRAACVDQTPIQDEGIRMGGITSVGLRLGALPKFSSRYSAQFIPCSNQPSFFGLRICLLPTLTMCTSHT